ncbi:alkaline phosphatase family protein [Subsaxibacter sp. CAU 1640]|uniref:alkaline phosphatase PafA n=1 Tax=Subsaxibacter sp. CAU 1640 TaxID=2933271 RepID=UPI0020030194|nr:alkaline phosphatase PafA [Subsaxibacter sp. CAU 1640]MCK7591884.1 alkaline phosphatase family protein [Subsaxibacter sp. CAU 1640]
MKYFLSVLIMCFFALSCQSQKSVSTASTEKISPTDERPKLVVGIVVDQMRFDYLTRFYSKYGEGGFKRMMNEGFNCRNNHFNYVPTYTGPGHASVFTGTTPKYHGIMGNDWYDKESKSMVYCAGDSTVQSVGVDSYEGQMSPHRMKTTSFADENRLFSQMQGKTIGISIKDRGAVLPAGHTANAAYWFYGKDKGYFISSTFYMNSLPKWVDDFNNSGKAESYLKPWNTLYDIETYKESGIDLNNFEGGFRGKETAAFPYDLKSLKSQNGEYDILKSTPYGNSIVADFAIAALEGEQLGQDKITDVLTVSFSSTDYVGHNFGVNSKEIEDTYIRLDKDLERFFNTLDSKVGKGNYTVFLTADHAAVEVPSYLKSLKIPAGYIDSRDLKSRLTEFLNSAFGSEEIIENISNNQVFLDHAKLKVLGLNLEEVQTSIVSEMINYPNIDKVYTATTMSTAEFNAGVEALLQKGFNQKKSGDILYVYDPSFISYGPKGSTHGSGLNYDTHVPLLFFGKGIKHGETYKRTEITDIAPTMSALLGFSFPNGAIGQPLEFVFD